MRLKNRNRQIPGGLRFYQPATKWSSPPWASFDTIVHSLINHRRGNKYHAQQQHWATDYASVADEIDAYNALLCQQNGWTDYITDGTPSTAPPPKSLPQRIKSHVGNLAAGGKTLIDWLGSGGQPVARELAEKRAMVCTTCPHNTKGTLTDWFTVPLANAISAQIEAKNNMSLATSSDQQIGLCDLCECPLKLKVWAPMQHILEHIPADTLASLPPHCWITKRDQ